MSSDRHGSDRHGSDGDGFDQLVDGLRAFGDTVQHHVDEPIRPSTGTRTDADAEVDPAAGAGKGPLSVPLTMEVRRTNRAVWLAAVALVLVAAGFGLGRLWPAGTGSIDSTGSPDAEVDTGPDEADDPGLPAPEPEAGAEDSAPVAPDAPSTITAADGTALAVIDDPAVLAAVPALELGHQGHVVARAVLVDLLRQQVFDSATREEVVDRLTSDGLTITTTFDLEAANLAQVAIGGLHPEGVRSDEVAVLTIDNRTGAIVALASSEPISTLVDGLRQPGSAFKPIVLATLFEQGVQADDLVSGDGPCSFALPDAQDGGVYTVVGTAQGTQSLRVATIASNNCAFVRLGIAAGLDQVAATTQDLGVTTLPENADEILSIPLGVTVVNGVELAGAYASFVNGGVHRSPWLITEIVDRDGRVLYQRSATDDDARAVLSAETAALVTSVLEDNVTSGTGTRAQLSGGHRAAGKTGTTSGLVDAWFVGSTARYTTAVWVGDPDDTINPIEMPGWSSFGGALPAAIWGRYNDELHRGLDPEPFPEPPAPVDRDAVTLAADNEIPVG